MAAVRTGGDATECLARQRASHLRRIRELNATPAGDDATAPLVREYTIAHLDADLRWLDSAMERWSRSCGAAARSTGCWTGCGIDDSAGWC
ncbi:MAG: hypothetical protein QOH84_4527 [Kribbellaceae bacterium]|nr:hypothetical protein [Kribbellaceae bacterium]